MPTAPPETNRSQRQPLVRKVVVENAEAVKPSNRRKQGAFTLALVAVLALMRLRLNYDLPVALIIEMVLLAITIPLANRYDYRLPVKYAAVITTVVVVCQPLVLDLVFRQFGAGNGTEIVMLTCLAWWSVYAATGRQPLKHVNLSVICSGFLTLFTTCISDRFDSVVFAYVYAILCLWWLVANQWETVESCTASQVEHARVRSLWTVLGGGGVLVFATWVAAGRIPVLHSLAVELMPTSGGTSQYDAAARSGVGDGEALIAARKNPSSFGAVESDMFLDSDQPSLFDIFSEEFGEPRKIKKTEQSQALSPTQPTVEADSKTAEANRSGSRSFSTERTAPKLKKAAKDLRHDALMFWTGSTDARLVVERFDEFDGTHWTRSEAIEHTWQTPLKPTPVQVADQVWFTPTGRFVQGSLSPFVGATTTAIQFTRYRSSVIPTQAGMQMWSVADLDRADLFGMTTDDCLLMPGRDHVPDYTVIRFIGSEMSLDRIEHLLHNCAPRYYPRPPDSELGKRIRKMALEYAGDNPRSWQQVTAVIAKVRENFRSFRYSDDTEGTRRADDPVALEKFLNEGGGPDYLFATLAAELLKQLGYEARLAVGFYINPHNRLLARTETAILPSDAHAWVELNAGHDYWLPLEPTPGFEPPFYTASLWYRMVQARFQLFWGFVSVMVVCGMLFAIRRYVLELCYWLLGWIVLFVNDRTSISWLRWVLDARLKLAGAGRPASVSLRRWLCETLQAAPGHSTVLPSLHRVLSEADAVVFGGKGGLSTDGRIALRTVWRDITVFKLLNAVRQQGKRQVIAS